jgi:hypothetical protein
MCLYCKSAQVRKNIRYVKVPQIFTETVTYGLRKRKKYVPLRPCFNVMPVCKRLNGYDKSGMKLNLNKKRFV